MTTNEKCDRTGPLTASPILAALRSTHGRGTPATPSTSGSVACGLRPHARHDHPRTTGPLGIGSETAPQRRNWSGERVETGTYADSMRLCRPVWYHTATCLQRAPCALSNKAGSVITGAIKVASASCVGCGLLRPNA